MNRFEMKDEFLLIYDRVASGDNPGYEDDEISMFLTKAQERLVYQIYRAKGNRFNEGFENSEKRRRELDELIRSADLTSASFSSNQDGALPNGSFIDLPVGFMWMIKEEVSILTNDCNNAGIEKRIKVLPMTHDGYAVNINNPFRKPDKTVAWRMDYSRDNIEDALKRVEVITDGSTIATYHIRYISRPRPIIITQLPLTVGVYQSIDGETEEMDCMLDESLHRSIIDEAIKIATGATNPEEYRLKQIESEQSE